MVAQYVGYYYIVEFGWHKHNANNFTARKGLLSKVYLLTKVIYNGCGFIFKCD